MSANHQKTAELWYKEGLDFYFNKDSPKEAIKSFSLAIELDPNFYKAYAERGNVQRYLNNQKEALADVDRSLAIVPNCIACYIKARILLMLGNKVEANNCFRFAEEQPLEDGLSYFHKGAALSTLGKMREALSCYDETIKLNPEYAFAYFNKGSVLSYLGKKEEAIECYDQTISLNPGYALAYYNKGNALNDLGMKEEAVLCYDKAIQLNPHHALAYYNKGVALDELGKKKQALCCFDQTIKLNPEYAAAYHNKGYALYRLGKKKDAIFWYNQAIKLDPNYFSAYCNKGSALSDLGQKEQAILCYDQAIELNPNDASVYNQKGISLSQLGREQEAINCYERAIRLDPKNAHVYSYNKGVALSKLGKQDEAQSCYDQTNDICSEYGSPLLKKNNGEMISSYALALNKSKAKVFLDEPRNAEEAQHFYEMAIIFNPEDSSSYYKKGNALYHLRRKEEALDSYEQAIQLNPSCCVYQFNKGKVLNALGQEEEALEYFNKAYEMSEPANLQIVIRDESVNLSELALDQRQINLLKRFKEIQSLSVNSIKILGRIRSNDAPATKLREQLGKFKQKKAQFLDLLASDLDRENYKPWNNLAENECKEQVLAETEDQLAQLEQEIISLKQEILNFEAQERVEDALREEIKAEIIRGFSELESKDRELYAYCKTFYWTIINLFGAYRSFCAENDEEDKIGVQERENLFISGAARMSSYGRQIANGHPFTGELIEAFDKIIQAIHNPSKEDKVNTRSRAVSKVIQSKFGIKEEDISLKIGKLAVAVTKAQEEAILHREKTTPTKVKLATKWLKEKLEELKSTTLGSVELDDNSSGAFLALFDSSLLISYLYKYCEKVVKRNVSIETQFIDILKYGGLDVMLKEIEIFLLLEDPKELRIHLYNKLEEGKKELQDKLIEHTFLNKIEKEKLTDYYKGFVKTFLEVYLTSQIIKNEKVDLDLNGAHKTSVLSTLICFIPLVGTGLMGSIESLNQLIKSQNILTCAEKMILLGKNPEKMVQLISNCAFAIVFDSAKQKRIINSTDGKEEILVSFQKELKYIRPDQLKNQIFKLIQSKSYNDLYKTSASKQGRNDATRLIQIWLNEKMIKNSGSIDLQKVQELFNNEIIKKDKPDLTNDSSCLNPVRREACQLF